MIKMSIYTREGDDGKTFLLNQSRVSKASERITALGTIDELSSAIGVAAAHVKERKAREAMQKIQNELSLMGAELAKLSGKKIEKKHVKELEKSCDYFEKKLKLNGFVLPGGCKEAAFTDFARAVARRAEREAVVLMEKEVMNEQVVIYLNRLSDLLFLIARFLNKKSRTKERKPSY